MSALERAIVPAFLQSHDGMPPLTLAVHSSGTLRAPRQQEQLLNGENAIKVGTMPYQIVESVGSGGMGAVYRAVRYYDTDPHTGQAIDSAIYPERVIVKEMTFSVPEMYLAGQATAQAFIGGWTQENVQREGLMQVALEASQRKLRRMGQASLQDEAKAAAQLRQRILEKATGLNTAHRKALEECLPPYPSMRYELVQSLSRFYAKRLLTDIKESVSDSSKYAQVLAPKLPKDPRSVEEVAQGLLAFSVSQDPAVKKIRESLQTAKLRFAQEAELLKLVREKGISNVTHLVGDGVITARYNKFGAKGVANLFLVETEIPGKTIDVLLAELKIKKQAMTEDYAVEIAEKLTTPLIRLNEAGIVHRDVKPHNVLVDESGVSVSVGLIDLGIAVPNPKHTAVTARLRSQHALAPTEPFGSVGYAAPESYDNDVNDKVDVFAVGRVLFCLLTGITEFGETPQEFLNLLNRTQISLPLRNIIISATQPVPKDRISLQKLRDQLRMYLIAAQENPGLLAS